MPTTFFKKRLHLEDTEANRLINCISQVSKKLNAFNTEIHKMENPPFDLGEAEEAINGLAYPQDVVNVLYFVSVPKSPLNPIIVSNKTN